MFLIKTERKEIKKICPKTNAWFSFFWFDLYRYIALKQFNNFKNYRYDFFIFSIFRFSIMFPVVVPRCSAPLQYPGWMGRSPRASCWVEVLEPDLFITFSLFLQCFSWFSHCFHCVFHSFSSFSHCFHCFFMFFHHFLIVFIVFS